jgi:hypothetical protein
MSILATISLTAMNLFGVEVYEPPTAYFPEKQEVTSDNIACFSDFIYSQNGELLEVRKNDKKENRFYVKINDLIKISIDISPYAKNSVGAEIGVLARILSAESLTTVIHGRVKHINMFTRVCIAETIRNRKNSQFGFFAKYNTYRDVILYTGYATNSREFKQTKDWLRNAIARERFIEEVLPAAIYVYFNQTEFTNEATGFFTPAKMSKEKYNAFKKRTLIEIVGIDPYYEFTFWKF